jgi:hypothetical protein
MVLAVELEAADGRRWHTIGGGDTLEEALAFARDSCPDGIDWCVVRWGDLYGDCARRPSASQWREPGVTRPDS